MTRNATTLVFGTAVLLALLAYGIGRYVADPGQSTPPEVVLHHEPHRWVDEVAQGTETRFAVDTPASIDSGPGDEVSTVGVLPPQAKQLAIQRITSLRDSAEKQYRQSGTETLDGQRQSLDQAYVLLMYEAALDAVRNDKAWFFPQGSTSFGVAWRNVPRSWRKQSMRNVTVLEDGRTLDMIVAVDPSVNTAMGSIVDQIQAFEAERATAAAARFNALPEADRRTLVAKHVAAMGRLHSGEPLSAAEKAALKADLIDSSLTVDTSRFLVAPR
jgi:hypothetical protein